MAMVKDSEMKSMVVRYMLADCEGIESWTTENISMHYMRAESNRQRHAIYCVVVLRKEDDAKINELMKANKYQSALKLVKKVAVGFQFPKGREGQYKNSLELIPNSKLNPW
jgi:hypothetical protein